MGMPVATLPMAIPVSLRAEGDPAGGNRFTGVSLAAPIAETDPVKRINTIHAQMVMRREEAALDVVSVIAPILSVLPDAVMEVMAGSFTPADVQASNVPGFPGDIYLAGVKILRQYGLGPLPGVAMMVSLVSLAGVCTVSVRYDRASITDIDLFARCLTRGLRRGARPVGEPHRAGRRDLAPRGRLMPNHLSPMRFPGSTAEPRAKS